MLPYKDSLFCGQRIWSSYVLCALMISLFLISILMRHIHIDLHRYLSFYPILFSEHPILSLYRLVTASFMHWDIFHLIGNLLFLVVFGRTMESLFGSQAFFWAFPLLGIAGYLVQWALMPDATGPVLGSSGAIAALMGAYLVLFPRAKIGVVLIFWAFFKRVTIPAWLFLPYWIATQLLSLALGGDNGIAYGVHVGSFFAGLIAAMMWKVAYDDAEDKLSQFTERSFS